MESIVQLLRLAHAGGALTLVQAQRLYRKLVWSFLGVVTIVLVGWLFNLAGWRNVPIILSLVLTALTIIVWFEPVRLALVAGAGAAAGALPKVPGTPATVSEKFMSVYVDLLGKTLLWSSVLLFTLGTIPFGGNPFVIFGITAGLLLLTFIQWQWKMGTDSGKKLFRLYVCAMLVMFALSLIPGPTWVKYAPYGWDPTEIGTTRTEQTLYKIKKARMEMKEEADDEVLGRILKKVRRGEPLTADEEGLLNQKETPTKAKPEKAALSMPVRALPNDAPNLPRAWLADGSPSDMTKWPRVLVPPHGDSVPVPSVAGGHIVWGGSGFKIRYRYSDGRECALGDTSSSCGDGNIVEGFARNEGDTPLYASYAYASKGEK